jgi:hypothetical protein
VRGNGSRNWRRSPSPGMCAKRAHSDLSLRER